MTCLARMFVREISYSDIARPLSVGRVSRRYAVRLGLPIGPNRGGRRHFYDLMLNEADYALFATMAQRHSGQKIAYASSFQVRGPM